MSVVPIAKIRMHCTPPRSMKDYLEHCPLESLAPLLESMEKALNGSHGPHLEVFYPFDSFLVRSQILVLRRDVFGRGTLVTGCNVAMDRQRLAPTAAAAPVPAPQPPPRSLAEAAVPSTARSDDSRSGWSSTQPAMACWTGTPRFSAHFPQVPTISDLA